MKLTNVNNLPAAIVNAIARDPYDRGACDISCTTLIGPPMIRHLRELHDAELVEDVSDRIWSLLGQSTHSIVERAATRGELSEERMFATVDGMRIGGQFDLYDSAGAVTDLKVTSVWSVRGGVVKPEWETQLNVLAYLLRVNGWPVTALQICAVLRDWRMNDKLRYGADYPTHQVALVPVRLWNEDRQLVYIQERVAAHRDPSPQPCTPEERWDRPTTWAVMKPGRKSALRVLDTQQQAEDWAAQHKEAAKLVVVERTGESVRCTSYCNVSQWCPYGANLQPATDEEAAA